jgi:hypothetical protein
MCAMIYSFRKFRLRSILEVEKSLRNTCTEKSLSNTRKVPYVIKDSTRSIRRGKRRPSVFWLLVGLNKVFFNEWQFFCHYSLNKEKSLDKTKFHNQKK